MDYGASLKCSPQILQQEKKGQLWIIYFLRKEKCVSSFVCTQVQFGSTILDVYVVVYLEVIRLITCLLYLRYICTNGTS